MPDFTSALYLGLRHPRSSLGNWNSFSLGMPAALRDPPGAAAVASGLARLQGGEAAVLMPSSFHLFWDLFRLLSREEIAVLVDSGTYPIARWGLESSALRKVPVTVFPRHDTAAADRLARWFCRSGRHPVIVADGFSPELGKSAPLSAYAEIARINNGYVVLDDTQALGILGRAPDTFAPYGRGGGGSLQQHNVHAPHVLVGASLAKGFGVPMAVLVASHKFIRRFKQHSEMRIHTSPPSVPAIHAAQHALDMNRRWGDRIRKRLSQLVCQLRDGLIRLGLQVRGGIFPVQTLESTALLDMQHVHGHLYRHGIETVLHPNRNGKGSALSFLVTASHTQREIDQAVAALFRILRRWPQMTGITHQMNRSKDSLDVLEAL